MQLVKELKRFKILKKNKKTLILGLSFKENTSDIRESRTIPLVNYLKDKVKIFIFKDLGFDNFKKKYQSLKILYTLIKLLELNLIQ